MKTDKICAYCRKPIIDYKNSKMAYFSNVALDEQHFFCNPTCKKAWLAERLEKSEESKQEVFKCKYCDKEFEKERGAITHETWCDKNPNGRPHIVKDKIYTIEDIREIDKAFKLTSEQIAKFVRSGKWVK